MLTQWTVDAEMLYRGEGTVEQGYRTVGGGTHQKNQCGKRGRQHRPEAHLSLLSISAKVFVSTCVKNKKVQTSPF